MQTRVEGRGNEASTVTVTRFRIVGPEGGQPAEVEIRGRTLAGTVHDGDGIEVLDQRARSGRYEVARLTAELSSRRDLPGVTASSHRFALKSPSARGENAARR